MIKLKIISSQISLNPLVLYLSRIFVEILAKPVCCTVVSEHFQICGIQIIEKCICEFNELKVNIFTHAFQAKLSPRLLSLQPQARGN